MAKCKYCAGEIDWEQGGDGRWVAYDGENGARHKCAAHAKVKAPPVSREPVLKLPPPELPDVTDLVQALNRNTAELKALRHLLEQQEVRLEVSQRG